MRTLPPLPVENYVDEDGLWAERLGPYTADQVRAYAWQCVLADREQCIGIVFDELDSNGQAHAIAESIRALPRA